MQVYLGEEGHEIMALVDTGSELNIIPEDSAIKAGLTTRCLNMNLRGIGGHCTSIVGLAEFTPITLVTGEERNIHLFVARGAVHTVLGRPFLADNNIRLDFSQQKGEIFSYIEPDGRRLCLPICSPQKVGWREDPPAGMETCAVSKLEYWKEIQIEKESRSKNQAHPEKSPHQSFDSEEMKESKDKVEMKEEFSIKNEQIIQDRTHSQEINPQEYHKEMRKTDKTINEEKLRSHSLSDKPELKGVDMPYTEENLLISDINETKKMEVHSEIFRESKQTSKEEAHTESNNCSLNPKENVFYEKSSKKFTPLRSLNSISKGIKSIKKSFTQKSKSLENLLEPKKKEKFISESNSEIANEEKGSLKKDTYKSEKAKHFEVKFLIDNMIINPIKKIKVNHSNSKNHNKLKEKNTESLVIPSIFSKPNSSDHIKKVVIPPSILEDRSIIHITNINSQITSAKSKFPEEEDNSENNISFKEEVSHEERNKQNQVKEIPFCIEEEPLKMEFPCYTSTRKDIECSFSTVQNINEAKIDESRYENSTNSLSQLTIKQELNQQKTLHPQEKFSGKAHNNYNIEKEINSRFKKLKSIRNNSTNECIRNKIHSPNILEKPLSESEYENEAGLFCQMEIQEEAEDEHKFILTEEESPW
ncbi:hypothetical protein O181_089645 [Austropuccinia psidii MF-1]|uniref:Peptidase A2 domain-containing protein n=1 Tax=Austropuccinia psidii MF-1 TaxID=1389203 RepID=A0A9Q3ITN5_9BASI|nr:hypothetical protein [Austropuccinia psidii MF-1]